MHPVKKSSLIAVVLTAFLLIPNAVEGQLSFADWMSYLSSPTTTTTTETVTLAEESTSLPVCTAGTVNAVLYPAGSLTGYTDCTGALDGNDSAYDVYSLMNSDFGLDWSEDNFLGKGEVGGSSGPFVSPVPGTTQGTLNLQTNYQGTFVLLLKGGDSFSMYLFQGINDYVSGFQYNMAGVNADGQNALSHASLWYEQGTHVVPEPATIILLGTGLLGVGFVGYRRRKNS